jgi:hypothetical protein
MGQWQVSNNDEHNEFMLAFPKELHGKYWHLSTILMCSSSAMIEPISLVRLPHLYLAEVRAPSYCGLGYLYPQLVKSLRPCFHCDN